ncbi:MAG: hypothetical protein ACAI34_04330 [Verrucomicrobium sp.]|nr:hypothetical protein [Verrucomicrobium sp.]
MSNRCFRRIKCDHLLWAVVFWLGPAGSEPQMLDRVPNGKKSQHGTVYGDSSQDHLSLAGRTLHIVRGFVSMVQLREAEHHCDRNVE